MLQTDELFNKGIHYFNNKNVQAAYDIFLQLNKKEPENIKVLEALASVVAIMGDINKAGIFFEKALLLEGKKPSVSLLNNYAHLLQRAGDYDKAIIRYEELLRQAPDYAQAWNNLGECYRTQMNFPKAMKCFERMLTLEADNHDALNSLSYCYHTLCMWDKADEINLHIFNLSKKEIEEGRPLIIKPFSALFVKTNGKTLKNISISDSREIIKIQHKQKLALQPVKDKRKHKRIRLGYFSVALSNHATAHLIHDMFKHHDRDQFQIYIYAINVNEKCPNFKKIKKAAEHLFILNSLNDIESAELIQLHDLDVLVDLDGVINKNKRRVLSLKPAPIQIAWLGYPGTSGAPWIDYILADNVVLPKEYEGNYTEKVLRMPDCYQFNSFLSFEIKTSSRKDWGIPDDKFIFASFNVSRKFDRDTFDAWCEILRRTEDSLLWLLLDNEETYKILQAEMAKRSIDPKRLIKADRVGNEEHLKRFQLADVFLDSFICNAHTTCTEALAAGLPVVTRQGETFASRVASSILSSAGMRSCISHNKNDYIDLAVELFKDDDKLNGLRTNLSQNKRVLPLFNQKEWVKNWENLVCDTVNKNEY